MRPERPLKTVYRLTDDPRIALVEISGGGGPYKPFAFASLAAIVTLNSKSDFPARFALAQQLLSEAAYVKYSK